MTRFTTSLPGTRLLARIALAVLATLAVLVSAPGLGAQQQQRTAPALGVMPADASPDSVRLNGQLLEAWKLKIITEPDKARAAFEQVRIEAERLGLTRQIAGSLRGLAAVEAGQDRSANAKALLERALGLYRQVGDELGEGRALRQLGNACAYLGEYDRAMELLYRSRDILARLGEKSELAMTYGVLIHQMKDGKAPPGLVDEALAAARDAGDRVTECSILHTVGDRLFMQAFYPQAYQTLSEALACYEGTDESSNKGRVLVSLGRVERAHGQYERAQVFYRQAYALQQAAHDEPAAIQSLNAIGVAYGYMGRFEEARQCYEEALARSRALGSERYIAFMTGTLAATYHALGRSEQALAMIEEALAHEKNGQVQVYRYWQKANILYGLDRLDEALEAIDQAVKLAADMPDLLMRALAVRGQVTQRMNRLEASDRDLHDALGLIEELRSRTLAQDFMKRGFSESMQEVFAAAIDVRSRRGDARGSLEIAEEARSRAFLDLLASRGPDPAKGAGAVASTDLAAPHVAKPVSAVDAGSTAGSSGAGAAVTVDAASLPTRGTTAGSGGGADAGGTGGASDAAGASAGGGAEAGRGASGAAAAAGASDPVKPYMSTTPALDIESPRTAAAPTIDEVIATAARLRSTLLVYWVDERATIAWVISPAGHVHSTTIKIDSTRLSEMVRRTTSLLKDGGAGLSFGGISQTKPWRDLYQVLIKPVRAYLPTTPGSLVTVVPHGPLFQVSFAALRDERGKYLIESYRLNYTPSVGVLAYTTDAQRRPRTDTDPTPAGKALFVGDPASPATDPGDEALEPLPWARREVTEIGAMLGPERARVITKADATEAHVREEIERATLLHFATHGVIRQTESMSSFLALARPEGPDNDRQGAKPGVVPPKSSLGPVDTSTDGKLTADEVYGLRLHADLVVLSACGTALGPMSGDGVIGFTRAFLYAGARSVIATEWNVPDQTGYEVMKRFYRYRRASNDTSEALREAQLSVLGALRTGKLRVETPGGRVALRENPLFWAGFVLVGKP